MTTRVTRSQTKAKLDEKTTSTSTNAKPDLESHHKPQRLIRGRVVPKVVAIAPRATPLSLHASVTELWLTRARQLQRFCNDPHISTLATRDLITPEDLACALALQPDFNLRATTDEADWVDTWENNEKSLRSLLSRKGWQDFKKAHVASVNKAAQEQAAVQENTNEVPVVEQQLEEKGDGSSSPAGDGIPSPVETEWVKVSKPREGNPPQAVVVESVAEEDTGSTKDEDDVHHTVLNETLARAQAAIGREKQTLLVPLRPKATLGKAASVTQRIGVQEGQPLATEEERPRKQEAGTKKRLDRTNWEFSQEDYDEYLAWRRGWKAK